VLEVVRPLVVDALQLGLLRVGLSTSAVDAIKERARHQFLVLLIAAALSGAFLVVYVVLRQNYLLLDVEHDRILRDVRLMEEEQRRSERLTSMGRLAAGVAHEIRNPLNAVSIIVQRLKAEFVPGEGSEEYITLLTTVRNEIARMGSIIESFLRYARPPKLEFSRVRIEEIISEAMQVIAEKARQRRVAFEIEITPGLLCRCDPDQFKQALLNLLLNAVDAIVEDGAIFIRAHREDREVVIHISDTGPGIPEEILPKIFDPYFTTKDSGTGLGLSEVHRIVTAHGGRINVENASSGGALFTLIMPD
jgi:signal transduction histidine kinase